MVYIVDRGLYDGSYVTRLNESFTRHDTSRIWEDARGDIQPRETGKVPVFISYSHDDYDSGLLDRVLFDLKTSYGASPYIDDKDDSMPRFTSGRTAVQLEKRIKECRKFILLATEKSIKSYWCNWELGFGDAIKSHEDIAILPLKPGRWYEHGFIEHEYLQIYPIIGYSEEPQYDKRGNLIEQGLYVDMHEDNKPPIRLKEWITGRRLLEDVWDE